jgi:hypothetical protein
MRHHKRNRRTLNCSSWAARRRRILTALHIR